MTRATSPLFDPNGYYRRATRDAVFADGGVASVQRFLLGLSVNRRREGWAVDVPRAPQKWSELDWLNRDLDRYLRRGAEAAVHERAGAVTVRGGAPPVVAYVADTTLPNPEPRRVIPNDVFSGGALDIGGLPNGRQCLAVIVPEKLLNRLGQILVSPPPPAPAAHPVAVTFAPDDRPLIADSDGTVWEFVGGTPRVVVSFNMPLSACVAAGSEIIGASTSRPELTIWNRGEMKCVPMPSPVTALTVLPSGELVTGGTDGLVRVLGADRRAVRTLDLRPGAVAALTALPNGSIFAAGAFGGLRGWRTGDSEPTWELEGPEVPFNALAPYRGGVVAFDERGRVAVWRPPLQPEWISDPDAAGAVLGTARNGRVVRARADGVIDELDALDFHPASEVAQLPHESDRADPTVHPPVKPALRPEEVIRQLFRWDALAAEQPNADQRRRAFQLSAALANAPALEGVVANGRFRVEIPFESPPRLEAGTYVLVALGHPHTAL